MSDATPINRRGLSLLLTLTALLSACLLFQIQPMVAKRILPWFGGGAAVWTTAMLFFQGLLFAGYLYAHVISRALTSRQTWWIHSASLALAGALAAFVGVLPPDAWRPESVDRPVAAVLTTLAKCVGAPYLMLAATAPLIQVWFARAYGGRSPYRLYAISNVGSLGALVSYPLLIEPNIGLRQQGFVWSALFVGFAVICALAGLIALKSHPHFPATSDLHASERRGSAPRSEEPRPRYFFWLALPACASTLLLAITAHITQHVAPIPLLWILPMVAYLLSFILTFDSDRWYVRPLWMPLAAGLAFVAVFTWQRQVTPDIQWLVGLHVLLLLAVAMVCHGELARLRPPVRCLTSYYLCIAAGGALGGVFTGIIAPLIFTDHYELHVSLVFAWLLATAVLVTDPRSPVYDGGRGRAFAGLLATIALLVALVVALRVQVGKQREDAVHADRNFYSALQIFERSSPVPHYELGHGHIIHGGQFIDPASRRVPFAYFHQKSGVGLAFLSLKPEPPRRVGILGLGVGTLAAYAEPGDHIQFYEINPQVIDFAEKYFTYLEDARQRGATVEVHEGDARLVLERQPPQNFDLLVMDAFNGDAVPVHLLTREAFETYLRHLHVDGVLAVHVSNVYLRLDPVIKAAAEHFDLDAARFNADAGDDPAGRPSSYILLHRRKGYFAERNFGGPLYDERHPLESVPWTDDYTNVARILNW
jgi:hypothetical protein